MSFFYVSQLFCSFPTLSNAALILSYSIQVGFLAAHRIGILFALYVCTHCFFFSVATFWVVFRFVYYRLKPMSKVENFAVARFPFLSTLSSCIDTAMCFVLSLLINSKYAVKVIVSVRTSFYAKQKNKQANILR